MIRMGLIALAAFLASPAQAATNLVINGGFEDGSSGWTVIGSWRHNPIPFGAPATFYARSGRGHMGAGCSNASTYATACVLSQDVATEIGATYRLSFWLRNHVATGGELYRAAIGDRIITGSFSGTSWTEFAIDGFVATASTTRISFSGRNQTSWLRLDDVTMIQTAAPTVVAPVPEPTSWALLLGGFGMIGAAVRRRRGLPLCVA